MKQITAIILSAISLLSLAGGCAGEEPDGGATASPSAVQPSVTAPSPDDVTVQVIAGAGAVRTDAPAAEDGYRDGSAAEALFDGPHGLAADERGNVYIADFGNRRIRMLTPDGIVTTVAGSGEDGAADGPGLQASFRGPFDVAVGPDGSVYVLDSIAANVRRISTDGDVSTFAGMDRFPCDQPVKSGPEGQQELPLPDGCPSGETRPYRDGPAEQAWFHRLSSLTVAPDGTIYLIDANQLRVITPGEVVLTVETDSFFSDAGNIVLAADGYLYVTDLVSVRRISVTGAVVTMAGDRSNNFGGHRDGPAHEAMFGVMSGLAVGHTGICVAEGQYVRMIAAGQVSTIAGDGSQGFAEGSGHEARFSYLMGIVRMPDGSLIVADANLNRLFAIRWKGGPLC